MAKIPWGKVAGGALGIAGVATGALLWRTPPVEVERAVARAGTITVEVVEDGRTRVIDAFVVSAPVAGALERIALRPGDPVAAGQIVARLAPGPSALLDPRTRAGALAQRAAAVDAAQRTDTAIAAAREALTLAEREAARTRVLGDAIPRQQTEQAASLAALRAQELASARFAKQVADHEVEAADALLGRRAGSVESFELVSPVSGVVLAVFQTSAGVVGPGTPLLSIGDPAGLEIVIDVLTTAAVQIAPGAPIVLERWGGEPLAAHVRAVEPQAFTRMSALGVEEQRVNVLARIDADRSAWTALGDAFRVEARIEVTRADGVLTIPESALLRTDGQTSVFRVEDGVARLTPVTLGLRNGVDAEVRSGLVAGDVVVVHPSETVVDGARVR